MKKINIFWIEDNPIQGEIDEVDGIKFPSFDVNIVDKECLSFKLFQHPMEVKEYLSMIFELNKKGLSNELCEKSITAIPDIVVFDYKLSDNFSTNNRNSLQYSKEAHYKFLCSYSAALELKNSFNEVFKNNVLFIESDAVKEGNYSSDEFKNELQLEVDINNIDDEFGLYSGLSIIREFKDYVTFGVPATLNKPISALSENSLFYEWLNSYDLKDAFERTERESKSWDHILKFALPLLRKRIETQISTGKIIPSYSQLNQLSKLPIPEARIFSFESVYGKRDLPLDGLFEKYQKAIIDKNISVWAEILLSKLPLSNDIIKKSKETATTLWNVFKSDMEHRVILSDYTYRLLMLDNSESSHLNEIKMKLGVDLTTGLISEESECSIQTLLDNEKDQEVIRLTTLLTVTTAAIELEKQRVHSNFEEKYSLLDPSEYFNILFPKVNLNKSVLLPMHLTTGSEKDNATAAGKKWLQRKLSINTSKVGQSEIFQFDKWITKGEKEFLKSIFYDESVYYPQWLK